MASNAHWVRIQAPEGGIGARAPGGRFGNGEGIAAQAPSSRPHSGASSDPLRHMRRLRRATRPVSARALPVLLGEAAWPVPGVETPSGPVHRHGPLRAGAVEGRPSARSSHSGGVRTHSGAACRSFLGRHHGSDGVQPVCCQPMAIRPVRASSEALANARCAGFLRAREWPGSVLAASWSGVASTAHGASLPSGKPLLSGSS